MEGSDPRLERALVLDRLVLRPSLGEIYVGIDLDSALINPLTKLIQYQLRRNTSKAGPRRCSGSYIHCLMYYVLFQISCLKSRTIPRLAIRHSIA